MESSPSFGLMGSADMFDPLLQMKVEEEDMPEENEAMVECNVEMLNDGHENKYVENVEYAPDEEPAEAKVVSYLTESGDDVKNLQDKVLDHKSSLMDSGNKLKRAKSRRYCVVYGTLDHF